MKRYLLFGFDGYYPSGGWWDFLGDFDSEEDCVKGSKPHDWEEFQIVDTVERKWWEFSDKEKREF